MKIFIDFDDVLFNSKDFLVHLKDFFVAGGINRELFQKYYYDSDDKDKVRLFNPYGVLERCEKYEKIDGTRLRQGLDPFLENLKAFVFSDVKPFLEKIGKENAQVVSFGLPSFQQSKIVGSGVGELVCDFTIMGKLKAETILKILTEKKISLNEKMFFIDDRVEQIEDVKKAIPQMITIFLSRKEGRYFDEKNEFCDWHVHNLKEAEEIISKL